MRMWATQRVRIPVQRSQRSKIVFSPVPLRIAKLGIRLILTHEWRWGIGWEPKWRQLSERRATRSPRGTGTFAHLPVRCSAGSSIRSTASRYRAAQPLQESNIALDLVLAQEPTTPFSMASASSGD